MLRGFLNPRGVLVSNCLIWLEGPKHMDEFKKKKKRAVMQNVMSVVIMIIVVGFALTIGAIMNGYLGTLNTNVLGNNANATNAINATFNLLSTGSGIVQLVVVAVLLGVALYAFLGSIMPGGGGKGRGGRK